MMISRTTSAFWRIRQDRTVASRANREIGPPADPSDRPTPRRITPKCVFGLPKPLPQEHIVSRIAVVRTGAIGGKTMFDGTCEIRRAGITTDGRAQLDLKAENGEFDWTWFLSAPTQS